MAHWTEYRLERSRSRRVGLPRGWCQRGTRALTLDHDRVDHAQDARDRVAERVKQAGPFGDWLRAVGVRGSIGARSAVVIGVNRTNLNRETTAPNVVKA